MAKRRVRPQAGNGGAGKRSGTGGGGAGGLVLAFVLGVAVACGAGYLYLHGRAAPPAVPVAPVPAPAVVAPYAGPVAGRRADVVRPPFGSSEEVFEAGSRVYAARCASCHGTPGRDAVTRVRSPQLFRGERGRVSAETPGEVYRAISEGAPAKGMPAYGKALGSTEIWQVALLLGSADQPLPDPVTRILAGK